MDSLQKKAYAEMLIKEHARDVEFLTILELAEERTGREISEDDARDVDYMINKAKISIAWEPQA